MAPPPPAEDDPDALDLPLEPAEPAGTAADRDPGLAGRVRPRAALGPGGDGRRRWSAAAADAGDRRGSGLPRPAGPADPGADRGIAGHPGLRPAAPGAGRGRHRRRRRCPVIRIRRSRPGGRRPRCVARSTSWSAGWPPGPVRRTPRCTRSCAGRCPAGIRRRRPGRAGGPPRSPAQPAVSSWPVRDWLSRWPVPSRSRPRPRMPGGQEQVPAQLGLGEQAEQADVEDGPGADQHPAGAQDRQHRDQQRGQPSGRWLIGSIIVRPSTIRAPPPTATPSTEYIAARMSPSGSGIARSSRYTCQPVVDTSPVPDPSPSGRRGPPGQQQLPDADGAGDQQDGGRDGIGPRGMMRRRRRAGEPFRRCRSSRRPAVPSVPHLLCVTGVGANSARPRMGKAWRIAGGPLSANHRRRQERTSGRAAASGQPASREWCSTAASCSSRALCSCRVVVAEQQFTARRQDGADHGCGSAAVTTVGGGECSWTGQNSGHCRPPIVGHRRRWRYVTHRSRPSFPLTGTA